MPVLGKRRVIRDPVAQIEAAEPAIREVQMHLFAEPSLRTNAEAIADQQHPDQQLGIDRRAAGMAVEIRKVGADATQVDEPINGSKQVILGNMILQRELVEQRRLRLLSWSHHRQYSPRIKGLNQQFRPRSRKSFSTK
ncbi:hypothetical protein A3722_18740 [Sulfitobacter sp. HI0027]|nr:hypothetical protein A3722_18740 [Sulfitobacter sp. HI0027]